TTAPYIIYNSRRTFNCRLLAPRQQEKFLATRRATDRACRRRVAAKPTPLQAMQRPRVENKTDALRLFCIVRVLRRDQVARLQCLPLVRDFRWYRIASPCCLVSRTLIACAGDSGRPSTDRRCAGCGVGRD